MESIDLYEVSLAEASEWDLEELQTKIQNTMVDIGKTMVSIDQVMRMEPDLCHYGATHAHMESLVELTGIELDEYAPLETYPLEANGSNLSYSTESFMAGVGKLFRALGERILRLVSYVVSMIQRMGRKLFGDKNDKSGRDIEKEVKTTAQTAEKDIEEVKSAIDVPLPTMAELGLDPQADTIKINIEQRYRSELDMKLTQQVPGYKASTLVAALGVYAQAVETAVSDGFRFMETLTQMISVNDPRNAEMTHLIADLEPLYSKIHMSLPYSKEGLVQLLAETLPADELDGVIAVGNLKRTVGVVYRVDKSNAFWRGQWTFETSTQTLAPMDEITLFTSDEMMQVANGFKPAIMPLGELVESKDEFRAILRGLYDLEDQYKSNMRSLQKEFKSFTSGYKSGLRQRNKRWSKINQDPLIMAWPLEYKGVRAGTAQRPPDSVEDRHYYRPGKFPEHLIGMDNYISRIATLVSTIPRLAADVNIALSRYQDYMGDCATYYLAEANDQRRYAEALDKWRRENDSK